MKVCIYRLPDVKASIGLSRSTLYSWIKNGLFVRPISLGARSVGWLSTEVQALINARVCGKSEAEIKALVTQLEAQRQLARGVCHAVS